MNPNSEIFYQNFVSSQELDELLNDGWRHHGFEFFRYKSYGDDQQIQHVVPLRIRLNGFKFSKNHHRILKRNNDIKFHFRRTEINAREEALFENHKKKFIENPPESLYDFLTPVPGFLPCDNFECMIFKEEKIVAASFLDIGETSTSSVYAMFDLQESHRSLGILTILLEIIFSIRMKKNYYYLGYAYKEPSFYDYKKRFMNLEMYDWEGNWKPVVFLNDA